MPRYKKGEWSGKYQRIMILAESGMRHEDIAKKVGLSRPSVTRVLHDERVTKYRDAYREKAKEEVYEKFKAVSGDAADKIIDVMKRGKPTDRIRLDAAKDILNYAGHKPKEQVEHITNNYTIEDANSAKKVIEELEVMQDRLSDKHSTFLLGEKKDSDSKASENTVDANIGDSSAGAIASSTD